MNKLDLEDLLFEVEKPARYIGGETNAVQKEIENIHVRFGFAFPDVYEVGMSHLGMHILYNLLNDEADIFCERIFAPWIDMEESLRKRNIPLFTLETHTPIGDLDFVGFTLQYELSYTNILNMLDLGNIPIKSKDRGNAYPFIVAGGPCAYNPEPLAEIVDVFLMGEGEEILLEVMEKYKKWKTCGLPKKKFLEDIVHIKGVYIPSFYEIVYNEDDTIKAFIPKNKKIPTKISKRIMKNLDEAYYPKKVIVPFIEVVHERAMVEIFRGCTRGCRFCQAGMIYRPVRERSIDKVKELAQELIQTTGYEELSLASLSTSDYSKINELIRDLIDTYGSKKIGLSLPSLRLDKFPLEVIEEIQKVKKTGLTFAPEAGTQRLRDAINKGITEDDLIETMKNAFSLGWSTVKLYFMIGLPTETYEDLDGIVDLAYKVVDAYYHTPREKRGKGLNLTISISSFVPKAYTPFQWEAQDTTETFREKQNYLKDKLKHKNIKYSYHGTKTSFLEGIFARGDRKIGKVLIKAWENGCKFDAWGEHFEYEKWRDAFEACTINPHFYANRKRGYEEVLPWDFIDIGVTKSFLKRENENAKKGILTQDCRMSCTGCGIDQAFMGGVCNE
ncbi:TIGR03960 family B12-binding radical SAM protein [Marinisporobacter balticus]|uniref:Radical SAM family uncharacterized protein n=1 Tax=Marinisporobacter balticus TaxID=2018667 RepID=A0A4R2L0N9_9FIRM|nr:TIGR03960 family B12-binding radical SAM protein [Marinisporobacter balticus]TCO79974.1 radical SAM family uncharacterized protein [Marinisporobacter balticus]